MESTLIIIALALLGLCFGSFVNAAVWRIKNNKDFVNGRSECTHCHKQLKWQDLVPVFSWLFLKGKCRYCKKPISLQYPLVELAVASIFIISYCAWPSLLISVADWSIFSLWLVSIVLLAILFVYDLRWFLLPDKIMYPLIGIGIVIATIRIFAADNSALALLDIAIAVAILSGLYLALFMVSKGRWIGFGDVKLGLYLGLALGSAKNALLCLFLANIIGCLIVVPAMLMGKLRRDSHVPFGPFLIVAFIVAMLWGDRIVDWYISLSLNAFI